MISNCSVVRRFAIVRSRPSRMANAPKGTLGVHFVTTNPSINAVAVDILTVRERPKCLTAGHTCAVAIAVQPDTLTVSWTASMRSREYEGRHRSGCLGPADLLASLPVNCWVVAITVLRCDRRAMRSFLRPPARPQFRLSECPAHPLASRPLCGGGWLCHPRWF